MQAVRILLVHPALAYRCIYPASNDKKPVLKIMGSVASRIPAAWTNELGGLSTRSFINYTIKSIDGMDPIKVVQTHADKLSGFSRSAESRFNAILYKEVYYTGDFIPINNTFYSTTFLGHDAAPTRRYVLTPPNNNTDVTFDIPWAAVPLFSNGAFDSTRTYLTRFCQLLEESRLVPRSESPVLKPPYEIYPTHRPLTSSLLESIETVSTKSPTPDSTLLSIEKASSANGIKRALNLKSPIVGDDNAAFYMLDDGETGVFGVSHCGAGTGD
ncbi:hypothetical protein BC829DRAFT_132203 [Chytridium lagenaria]|nr:hypothetical protein BC829DRAFT_132203 [Chytridium lagenaria]